MIWCVLYFWVIGVLSAEEFETEKQRLYKKKDASLKKQREDEAALRGDESEAVGNASLCGDVHVAMADHCQQAMAMAMFYHQLHQQLPPMPQATTGTKSKKLNKGPEAEEGGALQGETEEAINDGVGTGKLAS